MSEYMYHSGIKGQKWGIRRFQNEDGTLTEEGKRRYGYTDTGTGGKKNLVSTQKRKLPVGVKTGPTPSGPPKHAISENSPKVPEIKLNMSSKGVYEFMKNGRQVKRHLKDEAALDKQYLKNPLFSKQFKKDLKKVNKMYMDLAKQYRHKKLTDIDRINLNKETQKLDQLYSDVATIELRRLYGTKKQLTANL